MLIDPTGLLQESARVLGACGYLVAESQVADEIQFEDESLLGFVWVAPRVASLIGEWHRRQDSFLRRVAPQLRKSETKAWNLYAVFLSPDKATEPERHTLLQIEEDFRSTRKIAQTGITTSLQLTRALYPFIPIQNLVDLKEQRAIERFTDRVLSLPRGAVDALLTVQEDEALKKFMEAHASQRG